MTYLLPPGTGTGYLPFTRGFDLRFPYGILRRQWRPGCRRRGQKGFADGLAAAGRLAHLYLMPNVQAWQSRQAAGATSVGKTLAEIGECQHGTGLYSGG